MTEVLHRGPLSEDLRPLSALLSQQRILHRIVEEDGEQVLILAAATDAPRARELMRRWRSGELRVTLRRAPRPAASSAGSMAAAPVTVALIALSICGFLLVYLGAPISWISLLSFEPFVLDSGRPVFGEAPGQVWRLVTPVFLHFGIMHIVFNCLWCWELGRRIEAALGSINLLGLFLVTAAFSNTAQQLVSGSVLFGGLSGVVYGLLGFAWVAGRLNPRWQSMVPATPIMLFMIGWLLICMLGVFDVLGFSVANAAHVGGLVCGAVIGLLFGAVHRTRG